MVSSPTFNPNRIATHDFSAAKKSWDALLADPLSPLNNRGIEELLPPGSTFKLVTAAAALSSGRYNPNTLVDGGATLNLPQTSHNLVNESRGGCGAPKITLTRALDVSCNVAFGSIGLRLGADALIAQAKKFGWGSAPFTDLDDPLTRMVPSVMQARDPNGDLVPIDKPQTALSAIGQSNVAATPMQMAMVAAGIANNGTVMKPYLVDEIRSADLDVIKPVKPKVLTARAVSPSVARQLTEMMVDVVDNGTGTNAQIGGIKVAGKTGTAQSAANRPPYAWFVSFAPADDARIAVAVLIQDAGVERNAISGNGLAAPIAKRVIEAVLNQ
jgi:peptidoglycan glycosyltransferase